MVMVIINMAMPNFDCKDDHEINAMILITVMMEFASSFLPPKASNLKCYKTVFAAFMTALINQIIKISTYHSGTIDST